VHCSLESHFTPLANQENALAFAAILEFTIIAFDAIIADRPPVSGFRAFLAHGSPAMDADRNCWRVAEFTHLILFKLSRHNQTKSRPKDSGQVASRVLRAKDSTTRAK
jgi:hypothetical protein